MWLSGIKHASDNGAHIGDNPSDYAREKSEEEERGKRLTSEQLTMLTNYTNKMINELPVKMKLACRASIEVQNGSLPLSYCDCMATSYKRLYDGLYSDIAALKPNDHLDELNQIDQILLGPVLNRIYTGGVSEFDNIPMICAKKALNME